MTELEDTELEDLLGFGSYRKESAFPLSQIPKPTPKQIGVLTALGLLTGSVVALLLNRRKK